MTAEAAANLIFVVAEEVNMTLTVPVILLVVGIAMFVAGLVGKRTIIATVTIPQMEQKYVRIVAAILGLIFIAISIYLFNPDIFKNNVAPSVDAGADATIYEGSDFLRSFSFTDPDSDTWEATVDYGDGSVQELTLKATKFDLKHVYDKDDIYTVTVTVKDDDGGKGSDSAVVTVRATTTEIRATTPEKPTEGMVLIPAGEFQMGSDKGEDNEKPVHTVYLDAFYIDKYEVTNAQYKKFTDAKDYPLPEPKFWEDNRFYVQNQPVVGVNWNDASAYAKWAGKRLPTEAEWEKAARGNLLGKKYPWGDKEPSPSDANYLGIGDRTFPVGSFPFNGYELYDMAGNVTEWCADWFSEDYYKGLPGKNPKGPNSGAYRVMRGGSWGDPPNRIRVSFRFFYPPGLPNEYSGFRCAKDIDVTQ